MSTILPLTPLETDNAFLKHNTDEFGKSWDWLTTQYEQERMNLEQYEQKEGANMQYVLRRKSFLLALKRHLKAVRTQNIYFEVNYGMQSIENAKLRDQLKYFAWIMELHGICSKYFMWKPGVVKKELVEALLKFAQLTNSVRMPDAFRKIGKFPQTPFNLYSKT